MGLGGHQKTTNLLNNEEGSFIVKFARNTIERKLEISAETFSQEIHSKLKEKSGVFITLNKLIGKESQLRGCIGFP